MTCLALAVSAIAISNAAVIEVSAPGSLSTLVSDTGDASLTVSGPVNAADLYFIGEKMLKLQTLDLGNAQIVAYQGDNLNGSTEYPASIIPAGAFSGLPLQTVVLPKNTQTAVGDMAFASTALTAMPAGLGDTGNGAFSNCTALTSVTLPAVNYGSHVFAGCTALTAADLSALTAVPDAMFLGCAALKTVKGTTGLTTIGDEAFHRCSALADFTFGPGLTAVGNYAFAGTALSDADLSAATDLAKLGQWSFAHNAALASASFAGSAHPVLGAAAFFDCSALEQLTLPSAYDRLPAYILKGVTKTGLKTIPEGVDSIGAFALKDNASTELSLPSTLEHLGDGAMENMSSLQKINIKDAPAVPALGTDVWLGVPQSTVTLIVQKGLVNDYNAADQWKEFNVEADQSGVDDITDVTAKAAISGRFAGTTLQLQAAGCDIREVSLYAADGRLLCVAAPHAEYAEIPTESYAVRLYVVVAHLSDGTTASLKLAR